MSRTATCVIAALLLVPALAMAGPARFIGDDGGYSPDKAGNRMGGAGASGISASGSATTFVSQGNIVRPSNDSRDRPIKYTRWRRDAQGNVIIPLQSETITIGFTPGTSPQAVIPTAQQWLEFVRDRIPNPNFPDVDYDGVDDRSQQGPVKKLSADPPKNKILVVDQGERKERIDKGKKPEKSHPRRVTIVTRWVEARPRYENRTVVGYPCCCNITFSLLVGYDYITHVETTSKMVDVADYPTTEIAVDRGVIVSGGNPQYSTQIPRLCEFHYGAGATFEAPVVPLITDINDVPDLRKQTTTTQGANQTVTSANIVNSSVGNVTIEDLNHRIVAVGGNTSTTVQGTQTTITEPLTQVLIPGSGPSGTNYGGVPMPPDSLTKVVDPVPSDRGVHTNPGDRAYVVESSLTRPADSSNPYDYRTK